MIQAPKRRPGAPRGNRNAAVSSSGTGLSVSLYLNGAEIDTLDRMLAERLADATVANRRKLARELLHRTIREGGAGAGPHQRRRL